MTRENFLNDEPWSEVDDESQVSWANSWVSVGVNAGITIGNERIAQRKQLRLELRLKAQDALSPRTARLLRCAQGSRFPVSGLTTARRRSGGSWLTRRSREAGTCSRGSMSGPGCTRTGAPAGRGWVARVEWGR